MAVYDTPGPWLKRAVRSVLGQQCSEGLELILCDDASTKEGRRVLDAVVDWARTSRPDLPVRVITRRATGGPSAARNTAVEAARGRYVLWLDSDDALRPGTVGGLLRHAQRTGAVFTVSRCVVVDAPGQQDLRDPSRYLELARLHHGTTEDPLAQVVFSLQAQLIETDHFRRLGGFDEGLGWAEVTDLFLRYAAGSPALDDLAFWPQAGYVYHRRPGSRSQADYRHLHEAARLEVLKRYALTFLAERGVVVGDVTYLGRSPLTQAQHYQLVTPSGAAPTYLSEFFPPAETGAGSSRTTPELLGC
jgi:glycosyltransferase involved in cell wall biosynthesis